MSFFSTVLMSIHGWHAWCTQDMCMIIDSIPGTWSADQPKKYEPVSVSWLVKAVVVAGLLRLVAVVQVKEYAMKRFAANY